MSVSSIGIQTIMPRSGTPQQPRWPQQPPANDNNDADEAAVAADAPSSAPPPPGMGQLVDMTV